MISHDTVHRRQPEPGALTDALGGEEVLEDSLASDVVHADAVVTNAQSHATCRRIQHVGRHDRAGYRDIVQFDVDPRRGDVGRLDGVPRVEAQVDDDLLQQTAVAEDRGQPLRPCEAQLDTPVEGTLTEVNRVAHDGRHIRTLHVLLVPAAELHQLADQVGRAVRVGSFVTYSSKSPSACCRASSRLPSTIVSMLLKLCDTPAII